MKPVKPTYDSRIEWLPAKQITIRSEAQRPFKPAWAKKIAATWDPNFVGLPLVVAFSGRNGETYAAADGQHRVAAILIVYGDDATVRCEVVRNLTIVQAALLFRGRNSNLVVRAIHIFQTGVTGKDPECLDIVAALAESNLTVAGTPTDNTVSCVKHLIRLYRLGHTDLVQATVAYVIGCWGRAGENYDGCLLEGFGLFLHRHGHSIDLESLRNRLRGFRAAGRGFLGRARAQQEALGGTLATNVARTLVGIYNIRHKKNALPEWGTRIE